MKSTRTHFTLAVLLILTSASAVLAQEAATKTPVPVPAGGDLGPDGYKTWVECFVPNAKDAASVRPGERVSVLGTVKDRFGCELRMTNCKVLEQ